MPAPAPAAAAATPAAAAPAVAVTTAVPTAAGPRRPRPWTPAQLAALKTRWEWFPGFDAGGRFTDADFKVLNDIVGVEKKRAATWRDSQRRARKRVHARRWQPSLVAQVYGSAGAEEPKLVDSYYADSRAGTKRKQPAAAAAPRTIAPPVHDRWTGCVLTPEAVAQRVREGDGSKGYRAGLDSDLMTLASAQLLLLQGLEAAGSTALAAIVAQVPAAVLKTYNDAFAHAEARKRCSFLGAQQELEAAWRQSPGFAALRDACLAECAAIPLPSQHRGIPGIGRSNTLYAARVAKALFARVVRACGDLVGAEVLMQERAMMEAATQPSTKQRSSCIAEQSHAQATVAYIGGALIRAGLKKFCGKMRRHKRARGLIRRLLGKTVEASAQGPAPPLPTSHVDGDCSDDEDNPDLICLCDTSDGEERAEEEEEEGEVDGSCSSGGEDQEGEDAGELPVTAAATRDPLGVDWSGWQFSGGVYDEGVPADTTTSLQPPTSQARWRDGADRSQLDEKIQRLSQGSLYMPTTAFVRWLTKLDNAVAPNVTVENMLQVGSKALSAARARVTADAQLQVELDRCLGVSAAAAANPPTRAIADVRKHCLDYYFNVNSTRHLRRIRKACGLYKEQLTTRDGVTKKGGGTRRRKRAEQDRRALTDLKNRLEAPGTHGCPMTATDDPQHLRLPCDSHQRPLATAAPRDSHGVVSRLCMYVCT
eukprot:SAG25_NODE_426_length_8161_cov_2.532250_3_plen_707_part_00